MDWPRHGPSLAIGYILCGEPGVTGARDLGPLAGYSGIVWRAAGGLMIRAIRRLNEPASETHLGMALAVAAVVLGLMLWAILWQANIIVYQRDLIRVMWTTRFGGMG